MDRKAGLFQMAIIVVLVLVIIVLLVAFVPPVRDAVFGMLQIIFGRQETNSTVINAANSTGL